MVVAEGDTHMFSLAPYIAQRELTEESFTAL
jgi:hypothetical protein